MREKKKRQERGVTIIALVITVIVLLILAGISIASLTGDNGIINKSTEAKKETEISQYQEKLDIIKHQEYMNDYTLNLDEFLDKYAEAVKKDEMFIEAKEVTADHTNKIVIVVTKEGYRFEVTADEVTYVGEDGDGSGNVEIGKVKVTIITEPENWTNGKVKVKITSNVTGITKEYSIDEGASWNIYENEIEVERNGTTIQARGKNAKGETTGAVTKRIENIDRLSPNEFTPTVKSGKNKITITSSTTDKEATNVDGKSGIKGYKFSKDNGANWTELKTVGTYTYEGLKGGIEYPIKVKAIDNAGNEVESNVVNGVPEEEIIVPDAEGKITIQKNPSNWTRGLVKVQMTTNEADCKIQYSYDNSSYTNYSNEIDIVENKTIYARLEKGGKTGRSTTYKIDNIDKLPPKDFEGRITNKTSNSITVEGTTTDAEATQTDGSSGIRGYKFSKDNGASWTEEQSEGRYTYEGLKEGTEYQIKIKAIDNAGNEVDSKIMNVMTEITVPDAEGKITIQKNPSNWTRGPVKVQMTTNEADCKIQYSYDNSSYTNYSNEIDISENKTIYARLEKGGKTGKSTTYKIDNIDKLPPKDFEGRITNKTSNSITVEGTTTDAEATQTDGSSGIRGYKFSKDNGASWTEEQSEGRYTYGRLASSTQYNILIKAIDNAGNEKTSKVVQGTTEEIPSGIINFSYEPSEWTNKDVTVTISADISDYTLQYSLNGNEWNNYDKISKVVMKENGPIYARLTDGINYGITATGNVNNIDRDKPQVTNNVYSEGTQKGELYINIDAKDEASGVTSISNLTTENITEISDTSNASGVKIAQGKYRVTAIGQYNFKVTDKVGNETQISVNVTDLLWTETSDSDENWYSYIDLNTNKEVKVNKPTLKGKMKPIKYVGPESNTQGGSKWANANTADGSMWVWIPRYAYKITEGYHTSQAGTIEVAFLDTNNNFLNGETGELTTNVEDPEAGRTKWLVHPAFTSNAEAGGGFGEIPGLWIGKFETSGEYTQGDASKVSVKPGSKSLTNMTINQQYHAGKNATFGESVNLNSHMAKNSEWGATVYLAHSKYGTNKKKVEVNTSWFYTGGIETGIEEEIYTNNKLQSTTHNATGVYDLNGGAGEMVASYSASYVYSKYLKEYGGTNEGDLFGATEEEQLTNTKYKTVYGLEVGNDYEIAGKKNKGDAIYETSENGNFVRDSAWFEAKSIFPESSDIPFFERGGIYDTYIKSGTFYFGGHTGAIVSAYSFRMTLTPQ